MMMSKCVVWSRRRRVYCSRLEKFHKQQIAGLKVGNNETTLNEEVFDFYTPRKEGNFIDYINKYDGYKEVSDENNIGNEGNE